MDKKSAIGDYLIIVGELAKDMNFGVINISQINRMGASENPQARPYLHQLKHSGVIEEFSDTVMLLHWNWMSNTYTIYIEKQRHGETGKIQVIFEPQFNKFKDYDFHDKILNEKILNEKEK